MEGIITFLGVFLSLGSANVQPAVGDKAPTFYLGTSEGAPFFLNSYVDVNAKEESKQPILLSFFGTWWLPCKTEIPVLHNLQKQYPQVNFLLFNVEEKSDLVNKYIQKHKITRPILSALYSVVVKKFSMVSNKNVATLPQLGIIDSDRNLFSVHEGHAPAEESEVEGNLQTLLKPVQ